MYKRRRVCGKSGRRHINRKGVSACRQAEREKMICSNCGTQYEDGQAFCPNCGTPADNPAPAASPLHENNDINQKLPVLIGACVIVLLVLIVLIASLSGGYKKAVKKSFKYFEKGKSEKLLNLTIPKKVREDFIDDMYDTDIDEYAEVYDAAYKAFWDGLKEEGKVKFTYEIKEAENLDKLDKLKDEFSKMDLDDFKDMMDEAYDDYDFDADKIKKAYGVEVKWKLEVDGDKAANDTEDIIVYKYKGDWYVMSPLDLGDIIGELDYDDYEDVIKDVNDELKELN